MDGWIIDPAIITPILYKAKYYRQPTFRCLWDEAHRALAESDELVVIGYSFSPTDFSTRRLFRESFSEHGIEDLTVVNPVPLAVEVTKELCHYGKAPATYENLEEFVESRTQAQ